MKSRVSPMKGQPKFPFGTPPLFFSIVCFFFLYQNHPEIIVITPIKIHPILIIIIRWNSTQLTGPATLIFELLISPCSFIFLTLWVGESQWKKWRQVMRFGYVNTCLNIYTYMLGERFRRSRAFTAIIKWGGHIGCTKWATLVHFVFISFR